MVTGTARRPRHPSSPGAPFIFTNDDPGSGDVRLFHELLDFLRDEDVPATFFTVPCAAGTPLSERPDWITALQRARAEGHDLQLHAYVHTGFEFGQPPDFMIDLMTYDTKGKGGWAELDRNREQLARAWQREHLRDLLRKGQARFRDVLGIEPLAFRAPCCSTCPALYQALSDVGIPCDSSRIIDSVGGDYCRKEFGRSSTWDEHFPPHAFAYEAGVTEVPLMSEYTWYIGPGEVEVHLGLAQEDLNGVLALPGACFVTLSHFYAMTGEHRAGLDLYRRLFAYARETGAVRFMTLATYYAQAVAQPDSGG